VLHGLLHLAGYDHESDTGAMQAKERVLRKKLGLPVGLIERTQSEPTRQTTRARSEQPVRTARGAAKRRAGGRPNNTGRRRAGNRRSSR
jgi:probable rRNA maturation factor